MSDCPEYAVIIPAYNEAASVAAVVEGVLRARGEEPWEIIVVNDGSRDKTAEQLEPFSGRIRVLTHAVRRGYGASLKHGILSACARNVVLMDADGQHDPADLPRFIEALKEYECVLGKRDGNGGSPLVRRPGKWLLAKTCNFLAARRIPDINCGFRGGRREIYLRMLDLLPNGFSFSTTSLLYIVTGSFMYRFVPVHSEPRAGTSSVRIFYDGFKTLLLALRLSMLFDPMRAFGYPAASFIAVGVGYQLWLFFRYGWHVVGGAILSILTGIFLFCFGLLADQVASLRKEISAHNALLIEREEEGRGKG